MDVMSVPAPRETFGSRFGTIMTMIGVAVGLGNVWRFPYMVGTFGGAAFVLFYVVVAVVIGVPALMAEYALGRHTRRGHGRGIRRRRAAVRPPAGLVLLLRGDGSDWILHGGDRLGAVLRRGAGRRGVRHSQ